ncbi:MAG: hypothetical protein KAJ62_12430 [Desulfobacteraceae bacterium]|nr:hypothetical protein [Desulfobacteraceae bacterium]
MTSLKDLIATDIDNNIFNENEFARWIAYNDKTTQINVIALFDSGNDGLKYKGEHMTVTVKKADVPNPEYRHFFVIDNKNYYIDQNEKDCIKSALDGVVWQIKVTANERFEGWRQ